VVWKLWNKIVAWRGLSWVMPYALDDLQCQWLGLLQENHYKFERSVWGDFMFNIVWTIWNARNILIFEEK
jgi:hypothetical protein